MKNLIENTLLEKIGEKKCVFVFPTQTAADLWADSIISTGPVRSVAMERFVAWDDFKANSIRGMHQDRASVPSAMRSFFAASVIEENAENPFLSDIILPEHASSAAGFEEWISSMLPALSMWKTFFESSGKKPDGEDRDLLELYARYSKFLEKYNLFDPAWETPPFRSDGNTYVIFFPEILSDWFEYEPILRSCADIKIVNVPDDLLNRTENVYTFADSRSEIKNAARYIRSLHEDGGLDWTDIAVSVPDMESYGSYVEREFSLFQIPHLMRYSKSLSDSGAGNLFLQILDCHSSGFSYESVKNLLLNTELPWKDGEAIFQLVEFGRDNNCICGFERDGKKVDVWEESFRRSGGEERALLLYRKLKNSVTALASSDKFEKIRENYFRFRENFFDMALCPEKSDRIISRCISELGSLVDLEKTFSECSVPSAYSFFVRYIGRKKYLEQSDENGVQVFPYRLSAAAPFKAQVVLDASQASLAVVYRQLSFLREDKRAMILKVEDFNATEKFVALYQMNSLGVPAYFSSGAKTFTGYAQSASCLSEKQFFDGEKNPCLDVSPDFYAEEKRWYGEMESFPKFVTETSKNGNNSWLRCYSGIEGSSSTDGAKSILAEKIRERHQKNDAIRISSTQLKSFMNCPRQCLLSSVVKLEEQENEAVLVDRFEMGNLNHKILELYLNTLREKSICIQSLDGSLDEQCSGILLQSVDGAIRSESEENLSFIAGKIVSSARDAIFTKMLETVSEFSKTFDGYSVHSVEKWYTHETPSYTACGKIDCILCDPNGELIVIDFKSGCSPENLYWEEGGETPDFQIPMYFYLLHNQERPLDARNAAFYTLGDRRLKGVVGDLPVFTGRTKKNMKDYEGFEPTMKKLEEGLELFASAVKNSDFSIQDREIPWETCASCKYRAVCRKTFNVGRL